MDHPKIFDLPKLCNRVRVFRDRASAGKVLAGMLEEYRSSNATVMGIPAGGIAVAVEIARALHLPLDIAVVSKITLPWNSEAGYGAVAFDGTVMLNEELLSRLNLSDQEIQTGIKKTEEKVSRRVMMFRGDRPLPDFKRSDHSGGRWAGFRIHPSCRYQSLTPERCRERHPRGPHCPFGIGANDPGRG